MDGFLDNNWRDILSVAGIVLALIGFGVMIWQLQNATTAVQAATAAANKAMDRVSVWSSHDELVKLTGYLDRLKNGLRSRKFDVALIYAEASSHAMSGLLGRDGFVVEGADDRIKEAVLFFQKLETAINFLEDGAELPGMRRVLREIQLIDGQIQQWHTDIRNQEDREVRNDP